jgi:AcrR family transcriptional regulator
MATRQRIFEAALEEFRREGVASTQIDAIVRTAGVARGTFYLHFQSKDDVLRELQRQIESRVLERLEASMARSRARTAQAFFERLVEALLSEREHPDLVREVMALSVRSTVEHDWATNPYFKTIAEHVAALQRSGEVRGDLDPAEITGLFMTSFFGFLASATVPPSQRRQAIARLLDVFVKGIRP